MLILSVAVMLILSDREQHRPGTEPESGDMPPYPHHGRINLDCPVECLLTVLSLKAFNPLTRACGLDEPPRTVGDVVDLHTRHQLREISGLGPRRILEIEAALVLAELDITSHQHRPPA